MCCYGGGRGLVEGRIGAASFSSGGNWCFMNFSKGSEFCRKMIEVLILILAFYAYQFLTGGLWTIMITFLHSPLFFHPIHATIHPVQDGAGHKNISLSVVFTQNRFLPSPLRSLYENFWRWLRLYSCSLQQLGWHGTGAVCVNFGPGVDCRIISEFCQSVWEAGVDEMIANLDR